MKQTNARIDIRALAVLLVSFLAVMLSADRSLNLYDEGVILTGAMRVGEGAIPHRDFYANYGPGQFYVLATLFKVFHQGVLVERLWGALIKAALALSVLVVGRRLVSTQVASISCAVSVAWLCYVDYTIWPAWTALTLALNSLPPLLDTFEGRRSHLALVAAGAALGLATLFRYDIGFLMLCAELTALVAYSAATRFANSPSRPHTFMPLVLFLSGMCLVCVPLGLVYVATGTVRDFVFDVVVFPARFYAQTRSLPFPLPFSAFQPASLAEYVVYFPPLVCATAVLSLALTREKGLEDSAPAVGIDRLDAFQWKLLLLVLVTLALFAKGLVRVSALHMSLAVIPATIVLGSSLVHFGRNRNAVALLALPAIALGITTTVAVADVGERITNNWDWAFRISRVELSDVSSQFALGSCRIAAGFEQLTCVRVGPDQINAARYVRARSEPDDAIFVGLPHHDRIFISDVAFYFIANLRPATKWYHFDPGLQTSEAIQRMIVEDLEHSRPKFVVLDSEWETAREPNASAISSGIFLLDQYIALHYKRVADFGAMTVCELKSQVTK
jgi:hypothetical protein